MNDPLSQFGMLLFALSMLVPVLYAMGRSGATWSFYGVRRVRIGLDLVLALLYFAANWCAARVGSILCYFVPFALWLPEAAPSSPPVTGYALVLRVMATTVSSAAQELVYRGFMVPVIEHQLRSRVIAILVPALLFSLIHLYQGPRGVVATFVMGVFFGVGFVLCRRVWPLAAAHAAWNIDAVLR